MLSATQWPIHGLVSQYQGRRLALTKMVGCALLLAVFAGCGDSNSVVLDDESLAEFAKLPGLQKSTLEELRHHYQLLETEKATPLQLKKPAVPIEQNIAAVFVDLFPKNFLPQQLETSDELFPRPKFAPDKALLEQIQLFRRRLEPKRAQVVVALDREHCDFGLDHAQSWYADYSILNAVTLYVRLEAFLAAERLEANDLTAASGALKRMFRVIELLSFEKGARARLLAANLRVDALSVLSATLTHVAADASLAREYYHLLENQLTSWPNDADAWIGDRARDLVAYEVIRNGLLLNLLSEAEIRKLVINHSSRKIHEIAAAGADKDELFYLEEMRRIIHSCNEGEGSERRPVPYYRRKGVFVDLVRAQQEWIDADEFPFAAAELFLPQVQQGHSMQASDRARVEMWAIGLSTALGYRENTYKLNPLHGQEYHVTVETHNVVVLDSATQLAKQVVVVPRFDTQISGKSRRTGAR